MFSGILTKGLLKGRGVEEGTGNTMARWFIRDHVNLTSDRHFFFHQIASFIVSVGLVEVYGWDVSRHLVMNVWCQDGGDVFRHPPLPIENHPKTRPMYRSRKNWGREEFLHVSQKKGGTLVLVSLPREEREWARNRRSLRYPKQRRGKSMLRRISPGKERGTVHRRIGDAW